MRKLLITEPFRKSDLDKIRSSLPEDFEITQIQDFTEDQIRTQLKPAEIVIGEPALEMLKNPADDCPKLK